MTPDELEQAVRREFNRGRGRLAGLIESWGLDERREHAMIQTMKSMSYDSENAIANLVNPDASAK